MFDPISARFASSFSRNGMSDAATETELLRRDVDVGDLVLRNELELARLSAFTRSCANVRSGFSLALACATTDRSSSHAVR
jgi:hypothetical protein